MTPTAPEQNPDPIQPVEPTPEPSSSPNPIVPVTPPRDQDPGSGSGSDQDPDSGSGSDQDPDSGSGSDQDLEPESATIHLQVIDGYLVNASVFVDCNRNFSREDNEPMGRTDHRGFVDLVVSDVNQCPYPMKIISNSVSGDTNDILGVSTSLSQDVVLTAHVYRENISSHDIVRITPFTTLADIAITPENFPDRYEEYRDYISRVIDYINPGLEDDSLNISLENVLSDYNVDLPLYKSNLATLVAGELIVRTNLLPKTIEETKVRTTLRTYRNEEDTLKKDVIKDSFGQYKQIVKTVADSVWSYASSVAFDDPNNSDTMLCGHVLGGVGNELENILNIATVTLSKSFRSLGSGPAEDWRCGVTKTNNVYCVGNNSRGTLGDPDIVRVDENGKGTTVEGNFETSAVAVKVMQGGELVPLTGIKSVALGNQHACAVSFAGDVHCWGNNNHGQLGFVPNDGEFPRKMVTINLIMLSEY